MSLFSVLKDKWTVRHKKYHYTESSELTEVKKRQRDLDEKLTYLEARRELLRLRAKNEHRER